MGKLTNYAEDSIAAITRKIPVGYECSKIFDPIFDNSIAAIT